MSRNGNRHPRTAAFTLVELLVALLVSGILIGITVSTYTLFRKSIIQDQQRASITQNGRVAMDRLSRDIRQANQIVTVLPTDPSDTLVAQPHEIELEDGHTNDLTYRRYYVSQGSLRLDTKEYSVDGMTRVEWNNPSGPTARLVSTTDIANNVQSFNVYMNGTEIRLELTTADGSTQTYPLRTGITRRN